jgi:hypothetical protein
MGFNEVNTYVTSNQLFLAFQLRLTNVPKMEEEFPQCKNGTISIAATNPRLIIPAQQLEKYDTRSRMCIVSRQDRSPSTTVYPTP